MAAGVLLQRQVQSIFEAVGRMGADPQDSDSLRLSKRIMASAGIFGGVPANLAMTVLALLAAETVAGLIQLGPQRLEVVHLAVEGDDKASAGRFHGLLAGRR